LKNIRQLSGGVSESLRLLPVLQLYQTLYIIGDLWLTKLES